MVGHLQTLQTSQVQAWHSSYPFLTFFSFHHPKNTPGRHCGGEIRTLHKPPCEREDDSTLLCTPCLWMSQTSRLKDMRGGLYRTCGTTRCVPLLRSFWSSGCLPGSSWRGRTRSASAHPHSVRARSCQSHPLRRKAKPDQI